MTLGLKITRKADGSEWQVTGYNAGSFTVSPIIFGSPIAASYAALIDEFEVSPDELTVPLTEAEVLRARDAEVNRAINGLYGLASTTPEERQRAATPHAPLPGSPEAIFAEEDRT